MSLFKKTKDLVLKIDDFLDLTAQTALHFKEGIRLYLAGKKEAFEARLELIAETENKADALKKLIVNQLYAQTLIPESRGDVLGIMENTDEVIDWAKSTMGEFAVECPRIPEELAEGFMELTVPVTLAVESLVLATRAYFYDSSAIKDHLYKVSFHEGEADRIADRVKRDIFASESLSLSEKMHLRYFASHIDTLADRAEQVADRLGVAAIKRAV
ncbi:MAG: DUF47 family protein [Deltaproteobacteria bacterium]|nr:DUF47 family protein [Deltaproteobacteria bacterium]